MGRKHRSDYAYAFHHVFNRASARRMIFRKREHCHTFLNTLEQVIKADNIEVHAYCLMGNHYHLLLRTPKANLAEAMHRLGGMFTRRHNRAEKMDGPLFRGRYRSKIVGHDDYLRQLCRYIHRNPVAAGIITRPEEYEWSSYRAYAFGINTPSWLTRHELPNYFPGPNHLNAMREFVEKSTTSEYDEINLEKLLKGSCNDPIAVPSRCIGHPQEDLQKRHLKAAGIEQIIKAVTIYYQVTEQSLLECQPGKINIPRDIAIYLAHHGSCIRMCEIARKFSISRNSASSVISRIRKRKQNLCSTDDDIRMLSITIQNTMTPLS